MTTLPASGCLGGFTISETVRGEANRVVACNNFETNLGFTLAARRIFIPPNATYSIDNQATAQLNDDATNGRMSVISIAVPSGMTWASLGADTAKLVNFATQLNGWNHDIIALSSHEPDVTSRSAATADTQAARLEYAAFQTALFTQIRAHAPDALTCVVFGGYKQAHGTITTAQSVEYLPTNKALVDMVATDPYNATTVAQPPGTGDTFALRVNPLLATGNAYDPTKPLGILEMGCSRACGWRTQWYTDALNYVQAQPRIKVMLPFHMNVGPDPAHDWLYDTIEDPTVFNLFQARFGTAYFQGTTPVPGGLDTGAHLLELADSFDAATAPERAAFLADFLSRLATHQINIGGCAGELAAAITARDASVAASAAADVANDAAQAKLDADNATLAARRLIQQFWIDRIAAL